jgi:hypothetical protein
MRFAVPLGAALAAPEIIFDEIVDLHSLVLALSAAKDRLGISFAVLDELGQLPSGHASKILAPCPSRGLGALSLNKLLFGLGCKLQLVRDPETAPAAEAAPRRCESQVRRRSGASIDAPPDPLRPAA